MRKLIFLILLIWITPLFGQDTTFVDISRIEFYLIRTFMINE